MAKRRSLTCSRCGRRFAMAAHLGRHMATTHAPPKRAAAASGAAAPTRKMSVGANAGGEPVAAMIATLRLERDAAAARMAHFEAQLKAIDAVLMAFTAAGPTLSSAGPSAGRSVRKVSRGRAARGSVIAGILQALAEKGPLKPALVAAAAAAKPTTVSTALDNLRKKKLATRSAAGWSLTAAGRAELMKRRSAASG